MIEGYQCLKVRATKRELNNEIEENQRIIFYIAQGLNNLVVQTEVITPHWRAVYTLKNISFDVPDELFQTPSNYNKALADPTAQYRLIDYFELNEIREFTPESARTALLSKMPVGTQETEIYDFLNKKGIGKDNLSSFHPADGRDQIVCRIEYDPNLPGLVKKHFGIFFLLDEEKKLRDIRIKPWVTGP